MHKKIWIILKTVATIIIPFKEELCCAKKKKMQLK